MKGENDMGKKNTKNNQIVATRNHKFLIVRNGKIMWERIKTI